MSAAARQSEAAQARRRREEAERLAKAWEAPKGWRHLSAVNNTYVGRWYIGTAMIFMLFAGVLALMVRTQLAVPDNDLFSASTYNQLFTLHGTAMMFLFAVPIFEAVAITIMPSMFMARDMPFPRLSAFGYWCFFLGGVFVCGSIFFDVAPDSGWFMYTPLATDTDLTGLGSDIWVLGLSFIEIATIAAAVELIVGVLKSRAPGMRINLMPLYAWYVLVTAGMIIVGFPPLLIADIMFELERAFGLPFYDASRGGDPILWQHLFWIFGHPEVYIIFLPAVALVAMIIPTFAQRPIYGYSWVVLAAVGTAFISFGLWAHHMYTTGLPSISLGFFSAASAAVAIPTAVQIFAFLATLAAGRVVRSVPMLFIFGALAIFVFGGLTGVMVAMAPFDWQAHDSHFVVAHLHYTLIGGMFFPLFAGVYYYYPMVMGKMLSNRAGIWAFWLMFSGFNITFLAMHFTGLRGMPRRVFTYPEGLGWSTLNMVSTIGAFILAAGIVIVVLDAVFFHRRRPDAPRNPWKAGTLEWLSSLPQPPWGSRSIPFVSDRYPLWAEPGLADSVERGEHLLANAEDGRRETLVTSALDAEPVQCMRMPGPSFVPMLSAFAIGLAFFSATFKWWLLAGVGSLLALILILFWLWTTAGGVPDKPLRDVGGGLKLPVYVSGTASVGWWALFITMTALLSGFISIVFGYFFYWTVHAVFPPPEAPSLGLSGPAIAALAAALAWLATLLARIWNKRGGVVLARFALLVGAGSAITAIAMMVITPLTAGLNPTWHAYGAIVWLALGWAALQLAVGVIMQLYSLARSLAGQMTPLYDIEISITTLYWHFTGLTALTALGVTALFPLAN